MKKRSISLLILSCATITLCAQNTARQAFIRLHSDADRRALEEKYGVKFNAGRNGLYTALLPTRHTADLAADKRVERIYTGNNPLPSMDRVRSLTGIDQIGIDQQLPTLYNGKGVIVGVIDNGFDFTHPAFKDSGGKCRISCAWDQNASGTQTEYGYGNLYDTTEKVLAARHDASSDTHGTHVLGIAAGSAGNAYKGIAAEAEIVVVSTNKTEQGIIDGVDFLIKYAKTHKKPIAINISYGSVLGYKDGNGNFALMLDRLLKDTNGVLLSIATGNEGNRKSTITSSNNCKSILSMPSYGRENMFVEGEAGHSYTMTLTLKNKSTGDTLLEKTLSSDNATSEKFTDFGTDDRSNALLTLSSAKNSVSGAPAFSMNLSYRATNDEQWQVAFTTDGGKYMAACDYGNFTADNTTGLTEGSTASTLASTATGHEPIAVGAYVSRASYTDLANTLHTEDWTEGDLYARSGQGPTFDGRMKPDVAAPGASVISSLNSFAAPYAVAAKDRVYSETADGRTYYWGIGNGTSMATPVVTGIMALWLQANPSLTIDDAKNVIELSADHDGFTGNEANSRFGYGKINALEGLKRILKSSAVDNPSVSIPAYDIQGNMLVLPNATHVRVYTPDGMKIKETYGDQLDLSTLGSGLYVLKFGNCHVKIHRR